MISFKQFLSEDKAFDDFDLDKFKKDCAFYLGELKGSQGNLVMYRGASFKGTKNWAINKWEARWSPMSTPDYIHKKLNEFFTEKFGEPIRNWIFASGHNAVATVYGKAYAIFPIGKFEWISGINKESKDMTSFFWDTKDATPIDNKNDPSGDKRMESTWDRMLSKLKHFRWYHNTDIKECLRAGNEIMFKCGEYYIFDLNGSVYNELVKPFMETV